MIREVPTEQGTQARGRLHAPLESLGLRSLRCECLVCRSHLMASVGAFGEMHGYCSTCGSDRFQPVEERLHA